MWKTELVRLLLVAAVAAGIGGGVAGSLSGETPVAAPSVGNIPAMMDACGEDLILLGGNPNCQRGSAIVHVGQPPINGWICNGAFMPVHVQECLDRIAVTVVN